MTTWLSYSCELKVGTTFFAPAVAVTGVPIPMARSTWLARLKLEPISPPLGLMGLSLVV